MNIFLDIETIPTQETELQKFIIQNLKAPANYKNPDAIEKWINENKSSSIDKTALDGTFGEIVVIGVAIDDQPPALFYKEDWQSPDREREILSDFFAYLKEQGLSRHTIPKFIGHNITAFDDRFIFQRSVINNVKPTYVTARQNRFDTMIEWAGYKNYISLEKLCLVLGIDGKGSELDEEIDGSKVWQFVQDGKIEQVATYCAADVERVRAIYKRMNFME